MRVLIVGGSELAQDLVSSVLEHDEVARDAASGAPAPDVVVRVTEGAAAAAEPDPTLASVPTLVLVPPADLAAGRVPGPERGWSMVAMDLSADELRAAVHLTARGSIVISPRARQHVTLGRHGGRAMLTSRELEVLQALADGLATKNIGRRLHLAVKTVEVHKANLFRKLGVRTQAEAVSVALTTGLLPDAPPEGEGS